MKKQYSIPSMKIYNMSSDKILTASSVIQTTDALKNGTLYINGKSYDSSVNIVSVNF